MAGENSRLRRLPVVDQPADAASKSPPGAVPGHLRDHVDGHSEDFRFFHAHPHLLHRRFLLFLLHTDGEPGRKNVLWIIKL